MPALDIDNPGVPAVASFQKLLEELLDEASDVKQVHTIEPALQKAQLNSLESRVAERLSSSTDAPDSKARLNVVVGVAASELLDKLIATTSIDSPEFVQIWNLLDILSILSDSDQCAEGLVWLLLETLLDSQTITGCRIVFDYLESRRERLITKGWKAKYLTILRCCNDLLRRLSRAEDTAFCGRVFIFLFQCFPLGDRSSVNLRGEYHIENVTTYEDETEDGMDVDEEPTAREVKPEDNKSQAETKALYPMFWSLQQNFSQPLRLFEGENFTKFKTHLDATVTAFHGYPGDEGGENQRKDLKRKRSAAGASDTETTFNPKYLTSKDLFQLEISDLSFRRHILVQALILLDFLLSLSAAAKEKYNALNPTNRSVTYDKQLSEEDTTWVSETKSRIEKYLRPGHDGAFFFRMVETVLMRDKNWVVWKMAGCPEIKRPPIDPEIFIEARSTVRKNATNKRLRPVPMGSVSLDFLKETADNDDLESLKQKARYKIPELESFQRKIADDDFEISMPTNESTKKAAVAGKASKSWRALRVAGRYKMVMFDKIDDSKKIDIIFQDVDENEEEEEKEPTADEGEFPSDRTPLIVSGPASVGKTTAIEKLMEKHKGVFELVVRHAAREAKEGESEGKDYHFVDKQTFNQMRDGDRLIEYGERYGVDYGTSIKAIDAITEAGKVPIIELDVEAAKSAKDMDFEARYVLLSPSEETYISHLKVVGHDEEAASKAASKWKTESTTHLEAFEKTVEDEDQLFKWIYKKEGDAEEDTKEEEEQDVKDEAMADASAPAETEEAQEEAKEEGS